MDYFDIGLAFLIYSAIATVFAVILEKEDNILGRAFIWPIILLIAMIKAIRSVYLETNAELKDWKTVKKNK